MTTYTRQCSCGGAYSNCYHCNGSGMVQQESTRLHSEVYELDQIPIEKPRETHTILPTITAEAPTELAIKIWHTGEMVQCPVCSISVTKSSFCNHIKGHNNMDRTDNRKQLNKIFRHINKAHTSTRSNSLIESRDFAICPECRVQIKRTRLRKHMEKIHFAPKKKFTFELSSTFHAKPKLEPTGSHTALRENNSKKHDATYGNHTIRDYGKFGSHPSHDNFNDESGA